MEILPIDIQTHIPPAAGKLLIAQPFLNDPSFVRSVILLCEHGEGGSVGFALNRPTEHSLGDLLPELYTPLLPVFQGGPVQMDTLHMLHRSPETLGGTMVSDGVYWGGSYEALQDAIHNNNYQPIDLRLFIGYSGWGGGQLERELEEGSWLVADLDPTLLFETDTDELWKKAVKLLGNRFAPLLNMPLNPQFN